VSRKGKASPLEAGRGRYSPPANPERVTSKVLEKEQGNHLLKYLFLHKIKELQKYFLQN
jgi:hypothetical protein